MIRTGIFGGSFHPIHYGHIAVADYFYRSKILDEIWFVVSPQNPLKKSEELGDATQRLEAVKEALQGHPSFKVSDVEFSLPRPSYMAQTLKTLQERYPERTFSLIIGGDNLDLFSRWKDSDYILQHYDVLVYPRPGSSNRVPPSWNRVHLFSDAQLMDISSTQIRQKRRKMNACKQRWARFVLKCLGWNVIDLAPKYKKCVMVIAPHTSNWDFFFGKLAGDALQRNGKFLIKDDWFFFPMNLFFKAVGGIPVDRKHKNTHMTDVVANLLNKSTDFCVAITPEGTRKPVKHWKKGFYYIAKKANVPILLSKLDYGKKVISIEKVVFPSDDEKADFTAIKEFYRGVRGKKPQNFILDE